MDYYGIPCGTIRAESLKRLARLAASKQTLGPVIELAPGVTDPPKTISAREYETIVALCEAASDVVSSEQARLLVNRFRTYLVELPSQRFGRRIHGMHVKHSPWTVLAQKLTVGMAQLARFGEEHTAMVLDAYTVFIEGFFSHVELELAHYLTLVGVLRGMVRSPGLLATPDGFRVFLKMDTCIDNFEFLHEVEDYSGRLYVVPEVGAEYAGLLDKEYVVDFAPVLFLELLSEVMVEIASESGHKDVSLIERILDGFVPSSSILSSLSALATQKMEFLDRGESYIVYSTFKRLKLGYQSKAQNLQVIGCGLVGGHVDVKTVKRLFRTCLEIKDAMLDADLGLAALQLGALLSRYDEHTGATLTRGFTTLVSDPNFTYCAAAARAVGAASRSMSQDAVVTTIYTLTNLLFVGKEDNRREVCENATTAIAAIARSCGDETVATLAVTLLSQKATRLDSPTGGILLRGLVECAPYLPEREFVILVRLLGRWGEEGDGVVEAARVDLARKLRSNTAKAGKKGITSDMARLSINGGGANGHGASPSFSEERAFDHFQTLLHETLQSVISQGEVQELEHHRSHNEITAVGSAICKHLRPLAALLPETGEEPLQVSRPTAKLFRDFWFNLVVHGFSDKSVNTRAYSAELERIAHSTPALASETQWERAETSLELHTVLRRGSSNHNVKDHRHIVGGIFEVHRTLSYPKLMFLSAAVFVESVRVRTGDCATVLTYLSDPSLKTSGVDAHVRAIALKIAGDFAGMVATRQFGAERVASQLSRMLQLCCHRVEELQDAAMQCCDVVVSRVPSALCHAVSLHALFDVLTVLFDAVADADTSLYSPTTHFSAGNVRLSLPDDYKWRATTFARFRDKARVWVRTALVRCPYDTRALIESYEAAHSKRVCYGASFAREMGASVVASDREWINISHPTGDIEMQPQLNGYRHAKDVFSIPLSVESVGELCKRWESSILQRHGLFSTSKDLVESTFCTMEYAPSDADVVRKQGAEAAAQYRTHLELVRVFSSSFEASLNQSDHLLKMYTRFVETGLAGLRHAATHPFARLARFELVRFAFDVLNHHTKLGSRNLMALTELVLDAVLSWFRVRAAYPYGGNLLKIKADHGVLREVARLVGHTPVYKSAALASKRTLASFFLDDEIAKMAVWLSPLNPQETRGTFAEGVPSGQHIAQAYSLDPILAVHLALRYKIKNLDELLQTLITESPVPAARYADAVQFFIGINGGTNMPSHHLVFWAPLAPVDAITLFLPPFGHHPYILQCAMRSLEHHDVALTFFYVPQIVQALRFDAKGYVERFILEAARVSQLFAHQIIWNMLANSYKDEDSTEPDPLKPVLDTIQDAIKRGFSPQDLAFYQREFGFFNEVTGISGKLKPYIKKSKAEKKLKIDEEMAAIEVADGVYLPSNPDGVVVDINRKSGRPLQSHAKAPFMATFKIRREIAQQSVDIWQSAIFKVGDDCRQDVLALQLISVFRTIWKNAGLDLYVFPYRVTATAPGCGVIDVLPNSISRDMLGREAVNGLYEYFVTKFGPETSIEFETARNNLVKSLAAYSIISYLLQFKDRHNGNIMYDDHGHVLHIDFGFCFDIVPGGVRFEAAPFKLTHEMILVLGGNNSTQAFRWFEELCVKGYLACRPYMETIVRCVTPMLESGLPCFKDTTIKKLRQRFVPAKSERDAGLYMRALVSKSMESFYTKGYDEFQRITNGIPY